MDAARILKRFFFCERALIMAQSGWLAGIARFDAKLAAPRPYLAGRHDGARAARAGL